MMRQLKLFTILSTLFIPFSFTLLSCNNDVNVKSEIVHIPHFTSFSFLVENNPQLKNDVIVELTENMGDTISLFVPHLITDSLIASFEGDFFLAEVGGAKQKSGVSAQNFNNPITYTLHDNCDNHHKFVFVIKGYNGIPRIEILTDRDVVSKKDYVESEVSITNNPLFGSLNVKAKIKGRGNASWGFPKKPYKVKFTEKRSLFGFSANRDWVLLACYPDKSLLRTIYMCEISKAVGLKYTVNYQPVELILNGDYLGVYLLTEQVEKGKGRVNIENDGFIVEDDGYYYNEPLYFSTGVWNHNMTFKYPDADDGDIVEGDDNYIFIRDFMNNMESSLNKIEKGEADYMNYIEPHSFAKWFIAQEVLYNIDTNIFFVLNSRNDKLEMFPLWDSDWCLGLAAGGNKDNPYGWQYPPYQPKHDLAYWENYSYFSCLMKDPTFCEIIKEEWNLFKDHLPKLKEKINIQIENLKYAQLDNFIRWDILDKYISVGLVALGSWNAEVEYINDFFEKRIAWCDTYFSNL